MEIYLFDGPSINLERGLQMKELIDKKLADKLISYRHYFHENPELSNQEFNTTAKIKEVLNGWGIQTIPTGLATGVLAEIGKDEGPVLGLRGDIDALPIQEETDEPFKSINSGVMHACGHDTHIVSLLGAAYLLKQHESELRGKVRLIFQLSEEANEGALQVINDGQAQGLDAILGFHNASYHPVGYVGLKAGITSGAIDKFKVVLTGVGSHASAPQNGTDPIVALGAEINALQTIISRNIDPLKGGVVSITHVESGNTWNILPETAFFEGTVRTADKDVRKLIKNRFIDLVKLTAKAYGVTVDIDWYSGDPSVNNDQFLTNIVRDESSKFTTVYEMKPQLGSDDFACYQEKIPGVYANIGNGRNVGHHNPHFTADDNTVIYGAEFFEVNSIRILKELNKNSN